MGRPRCPGEGTRGRRRAGRGWFTFSNPLLDNRQALRAGPRGRVPVVAYRRCEPGGG